LKRKSTNDPYDEVGHLFDYLYGADPKETEKDIESLKVLLNKNKIKIKESIIADIGGGSGRFAFPLSNICKKVILIEPSEQVIKVAKEKEHNHENGEIEYRQEGFLNISLLSDSVDAVISMGGVFYYLLDLKDQIIALKNILNILKPGGFVLIDTQNFFSLIKNYNSPKPMKWQTTTHKYQRQVEHINNPFQEIWTHVDRVSIREKSTGIMKEISSVHRLKMFSPTELKLLFQNVGFSNIKLYPGRDIYADEGSRIWVTALKPNKL